MVDQRVADLRPRDHLKREIFVLRDHCPQQLERRLRDLRRGGGGETFRFPTGESSDYFRIFRALIPQAQKLTVQCIFPGLVPPCAVFYGSRFREIVLVVRLLPVGPFLPAAQPIGPYVFQDHGDGH